MNSLHTKMKNFTSQSQNLNGKATNLLNDNKFLPDIHYHDDVFIVKILEEKDLFIAFKKVLSISKTSPIPEYLVDFRGSCISKILILA